MARFEIHLFPARDHTAKPAILSMEDWSRVVRAAMAFGATEREVFAHHDARQFAKAIRTALNQPPRPLPTHRRSHVLDYLQPADHKANLEPMRESGLLDQVLALFDGPDGVQVVRATAREHRALAPR